MAASTGQNGERERERENTRTVKDISICSSERVLPSGLIEKSYYATQSLMIRLFRALIAIIFSFVRLFFFFPSGYEEELGE